MLTIRRASVSDAAAISAFGRRAFLETFAAQNTPEDMERYLSSAFGEAVQSGELSDANTTTFITEDEGVVVAYAQLRSGEAPPCVSGPAPIELARFYVDSAWHGRGIAQALMREAEKAAGLDHRTLWLGVWEHNARAIAFYSKCGFVDVGSHVFHLGGDPQIDRIMTKPLAPIVR